MNTINYQQREPKDRVLYLDIDDTLICYPHNPKLFKTVEDEHQWWMTHPNGAPPKNIATCLEFFHEHFEIRWLTLWCPSGKMNIDLVVDLSDILQISPEMVVSIENPKPFWGRQYDHDLKTNGIDFDDPRPWVWIEDEIPPKEKDELRRHGVLENYIPCDVSENPNRLVEVVEILKKRFNLA